MTREFNRVISPKQARAISLEDALDEFLLALRAGQRSPETLLFYQKKVGRFIRWCTDGGHPTDVDGIQVGHLRLWLIHMQADPRLADTSIQSYYRAVKAFFNWCAREEMLDQSPFATRRVPQPKAAQRIKPSFSDDDLRSLLRSARESRGEETGLRDYAILLLLIDTGLRASELCRLDLSDVEPGRVRVMGKGAKERFLSISPMTEKALRDYLRKGRRADKGQTAAFVSRIGQRLTVNALEQMLRQRGHTAGVEGVRPHAFRHTFALTWAADGGPLHALQAILGHESPLMSLRYGRMAGAEQTAELHRQHSPVARLKLGKKKR